MRKKSCENLVNVKRNLRKYSRFCKNVLHTSDFIMNVIHFGEQVNYFTFSVLPFGLSSVGYIFTKTVRVLVKYWRSIGFPIVVYLDDRKL